MTKDKAEQVVDVLEELIRVMILAENDSRYYLDVMESKDELVKLLVNDEVVEDDHNN